MAIKRNTRRAHPFLLTLLIGCATALVGNPSPGAEPAVAVGGPLPNARIEVHKARRELLLFSGETLVGTFPVGLGFQPSGSKTRQGDGATPEGEYFVCVKNPQSRYFLSLGLNYPNASDAAAALAAGLITTPEQQRIARAEQRGTCPPWGTPLGGEIFIHGRGAAADWTLGCVALNDPDMERLFHAVKIGTRVEIKP
jgi:murein L,D-transpeptidase YafK